MESGPVAIGVPIDPDRARALIVRGRRIARRRGAAWLAILVVSSRGMRTEALTEFVEACGGRLLCAEARDEVRTLIEIAIRERAQALVIGRSRRPRVLRRLRRGTTERIVESARPFDVIVARDGVAP